MKVLKFFKSRKTVAVLLIILSITTAISLSNIFWNKGNMQSSFIEYLYFSSQIINSIFVTGGVIIAVWQYYLSSQSTKKNLELVQVQRAIELSEYYKDHILKHFHAIHYVFKETGILNICNSIDKDKIITFDYDESTHLFTEEQITKLKNIQDSENFTKAVLEANYIYKLNLHLPSCETETLFLENLSDSEHTPVSENKPDSLANTKKRIAIAFMANLINGTLNNLEYFALHFSHNVADESVVFQSLHQSFLANIPYLYYYIAKKNTNSAKKLFTNVIWLYNTWKAEEKEQLQKRYQKIAILTDPRTVIQKY